jgi:hypothetical protein
MLTVSSPLGHSYAAQVTQVIRVPEYTHVQIQRGASLRAVPWNGGTGGVVAFLATGTVENEGEITATGAGFRGGRYVPDSSDPVVCSSMAVGAGPGARKGEGVAVTQYGPAKTGRERVSNEGGGGMCPLAGGGGGGNGGAGGDGGGVETAGADVRETGGQGGAKLGYSLLDRLSFGGGGGSGHGEDWSGPDAGAGGGAIFIRAARLSGGGFIVADGEAGGSSSVGGASGGGAGGSISLRLSGDAVCGGVSARGGWGGDATGIMPRGGEGGGGGGGRVLFRVGAASRCAVSVVAGVKGARLHLDSAMGSRSGDGLAEEQFDSFATTYPAGVKITSPGDRDTVRARPTIEICMVDSDGACGTTATGGPYSYIIYLNGQSWMTSVSASASWTYTPIAGLSDGVTYEVGVDASGTGPGSKIFKSNVVRFTVDAKAPDTVIANPKPPSKTSQTSASFSFSSRDVGATFKCALDALDDSKDEPLDDCESPKLYTGLSDGSYTFSVRAEDAVGNVDESPDTHTWRVDATPPGETVINIDKAPANHTNINSATFEFSAGGDLSYYECMLESVPSGTRTVKRCVSPEPYTSLADGTYSFSVWAVDDFGNKGKSATHVWSVDTSPPEPKVLNPFADDMVNTQFPAISGLVDDRDSRIQVFIDDLLIGETRANAEGYWALPTVNPLSDGPHFVYARAINLADRAGSSAPSKFTVDTVRPDTRIIKAPPKISNSRVAAFEFMSPGGDATEFQCQLDSQPFTSCGATPVFMNLPEGEHILQVRARDGAGNRDDTPEIYQWTIVIILPPVPEIEQPADGATVDTGTPAIIGWAVPKSTVTIYIDGQKSGVAQADDSGSWTFRPPTPLAEGKHTVTTEATDEAGNTSAQHSLERVFSILLPKGKARAIGGGLSCASSGGGAPSAWLLLISGLWLARYRRRSPAA